MLYLPAPTVVELPSGFQVTVNVPDEETVDGTYATIRPARSTAPNGAWTPLSDHTLVDGTRQYSQVDTSGLITSWYSYILRTGGGVESRRSEAVPAMAGQVYTLLELVRRTAYRIDCFGMRPTATSFPAASGTVTSNSTAAAAAVIDSAYKNTLLTPEFWRRRWLRFNDGDNSGAERQIALFDPSTGKFIVSSEFSNTVDTNDTFDVYALYQWQNWVEWVNQARGKIWVPFDWPLVGIQSQTEYVLPGFIQSADQITNVNRRSGEVLHQHSWMGDAVPELRTMENGRVMAIFTGAPSDNDVYYIRGRRNPPRLLDATDAWVLSEEQMEMVVVTAAVEACRHIATQHPSVAEDRSMWLGRLKLLEDQRERMAPTHNTSIRKRRFPGTPMVPLGGDHPLSRR